MTHRRLRVAVAFAVAAAALPAAAIGATGGVPDWMERMLDRSPADMRAQMTSPEAQRAMESPAMTAMMQSPGMQRMMESGR